MSIPVYYDPDADPNALPGEPRYGLPVLQRIFRIFAKWYGVDGAVAKMAGEPEQPDPDTMFHDGVSLDALDHRLAFELFDLSALAPGWEPQRFVLCGGHPECGLHRAGSGVCLEIQHLETGKVARCPGGLYPLIPRVPGWARPNAVEPESFELHPAEIGQQPAAGNLPTSVNPGTLPHLPRAAFTLLKLVDSRPEIWNLGREDLGVRMAGEAGRKKTVRR
jgi:hypothetical protein